jgi:hypothetical protein
MYQCDGCGTPIPRTALRYQVTIDVRASYDTLEVSLFDLIRDHQKEMEELVARMRRQEANDLEQQIYKKIVLDLCPECQKKFIRSPLNCSNDSKEATPVTDIDSFLRSLGYGESPQKD